MGGSSGIVTISGRGPFRAIWNGAGFGDAAAAAPVSPRAVTAAAVPAASSSWRRLMPAAVVSLMVRSPLVGSGLAARTHQNVLIPHSITRLSQNSLKFVNRE